jgi:1,4-alpha-glucan branching enzyme
MIKKTYSKQRKSCRITFGLPPEINAQAASVCGEFNAWEVTKHPMKRLSDGSFTLTIALQPGQPYRFCYLLDGTRWENDWSADAFVPNTFGSNDSVVNL